MIQNLRIQMLERTQCKADIPKFRVGDTLEVHIRIIEGEKERIQVFSGTVIARRGGGLAETVALYRVSYGAGVERVFSIHSPRIAKIIVVREGKVRRAKLYELRGVAGKKAKVQGRLGGKKVVVAPSREEEAGGETRSEG